MQFPIKESIFRPLHYIAIRALLLANLYQHFFNSSGISLLTPLYLGATQPRRKTRNRTQGLLRIYIINRRTVMSNFRGKSFRNRFTTKLFSVSVGQVFRVSLIPTLLQFIFKVCTPFRPPTATKGLLLWLGFAPNIVKIITNTSLLFDCYFAFISRTMTDLNRCLAYSLVLASTYSATQQL